ncbi:MAG: hypothetical protein KID04_14640 [Clostridium sp.]|nr:hypothetical protein [Clostridium sp.]DAI95690.1 MAG TPA: hypothetical protein [Caudoviricetes sp.]
MPELWTPSGGVNRKLKELYTPSGGVNRKLKELYAVSGGVNRKIFSAGVEYTITGQYYPSNDWAYPGATIGGAGSISLWQSFRNYSWYWTTLQLEVNFGEAIPVASGTQILSISGEVFNENGRYNMENDDGYPPKTGLFVGLNVAPSISVIDTSALTRILAPNFPRLGSISSIPFNNILYNAPSNLSLTKLCLRLQAESGGLNNDWWDLKLTLPSGGLKILGQPITAGPTGYLQI